MADYVNPNTCEVAISVNTREPPWVQISREMSVVWMAIPQQYRKWVTDHIEEMTQPETDAVPHAVRRRAQGGVSCVL